MWPDVSCRMSPTVARTLYVAAVRRFVRSKLVVSENERDLSYLCVLDVVSRVGTETERRRCEDGIFLLKRTPIALRLLALSRVQPRRAFTSGRRGRGPERAEPDSESH